MARIKGRIWQQALIIAAIPLTIGCLLFSAMWVLLGQMEHTAALEQQASECADQVNKDVLTIGEAYLVSWNFINTHQQRYIAEYKSKINKSIDGTKRLLDRNSDNDVQKKYLTRNLNLMIALRDAADEVAPLFLSDNPATQLQLMMKQRAMLKILVEAQKSNGEELTEIAASLQSSEEALDKRDAQSRTVILFGFIVCCIATVAVALMVRRAAIGRILALRRYVDALLSGKPIAARASGSDEISELERAFSSMSREISSAIRREQAVMQGANVMLVVRGDGVVRSVNQALSDFWQIALQQAIDKPVTRLFAEPDREPFAEALQRARQTKRSQTVETRIGDKHASWSCTWSREEQMFYCVGHDITDLKAREQALRANRERIAVLMDSMPAALFILDANDVIVRVNRESCQLLALPSSDIVGRPLSEFTDTTAVAAGTAVNRRTFRRSDETSIWCEVSVDVLDSSGERLIVALDVDEKVKVEQMRDRLKAMIAHDIGAPLSSIQATFKSLLIERYGAINPAGITRAKTAVAETTRLIALFKDFVAIEKHGANKWSLDFTPLNLHEVVGKSVEAVAALAERSGVSFKLDSTPVQVFADKDKLTQLVINLLTNALKFTPLGSSIHISVNHSDVQAQIKVRDEGPGVPPHMLETIFEPFKQTNITDQTVKGGAGLGLAICKSIVESHRGTISVANHTTGGAEFTVELPLDMEIG